MIRLHDEELEQAVIDLRENGKLLGIAESQYEYLIAMQKTTKATIFLETKDHKLTIKEREAIAETHKDVVKYTPLIKEQKQKYIEIRHRISSILENTNLWRTRSANLRGEKKLYGELG